MTKSFLPAVAGAVMLALPVAAQDIAATAAPQPGFGLIDALSARPSLLGRIDGQLYRIDDNVEIGRNQWGVVARLRELSGSENWPVSSRDPEVVAMIEAWQEDVKNSANFFGHGQDHGPLSPMIPSDFFAADEPSGSTEPPEASALFEPLLLPVHEMPAFHVVFPMAAVDTGFFASF